MSLDHQLLKALHIEHLRRRDLRLAAHEHHTLFQTSTLDALLEGRYQGEMTFAELARNGDLGIGTFDHLDGEMIQLEGSFYQAKGDGTIHAVDPAMTTPFAVVTWFDPDFAIELPHAMVDAGLREFLDGRLPNAAILYTVRVDGLFSQVQVRSVPRQEPPYRPLAEVLAEQPTFNRSNVAGTLLGFRFPDYAQGLNVPGYHLHFLSDDRQFGGHLVRCEIAAGVLKVDHTSDLHLETPPGVELPTPAIDPDKRALIDRMEGDRSATA